MSKAYGYGRGDDTVIQHEKVLLKAHRMGLDFQGFTEEQFTEEPLNSRLKGWELVSELMQPGDYLMAWKFSRIFTGRKDCEDTIAFMKTRGLKLAVMDCLHINVDAPKEKVAGWSKRRAHMSLMELMKLRGDGRPPVGWKRYGDEVVPYKEERLASLEVKRLRDEEKLSWEDILMINTRTRFWPTTPFSRARAIKAYEAAGERFPGPEGEIQESVEGTGI